MRLSSGSNYAQIPHHDLIVLGELENFLHRALVHHRSAENKVDWPSVRAEYAQHPDRPELMKRYVSSLLDERARACPSPIVNKNSNKSTPSGVATSSSSSSGRNTSNEEDKLKAVDEFVDSVISRKRQRESDRSLRLLDSLLDKLVERKRDELAVTEAEIRNLEAFVQQLKVNHPSKQNNGNKIIIRTTRKLPARVYITGNSPSSFTYIKNLIPCSLNISTKMALFNLLRYWPFFHETRIKFFILILSVHFVY